MFFGIIKNKYKKNKNIDLILKNFDLDLWDFYCHAFDNIKYKNFIFT
jgi:hypothetical protein